MLLCENHTHGVDIKHQNELTKANSHQLTVLNLNLNTAGFHTAALTTCCSNLKILFQLFLCANIEMRKIKIVFCLAKGQNSSH